MRRDFREALTRRSRRHPRDRSRGGCKYESLRWSVVGWNRCTGRRRWPMRRSNEPRIYGPYEHGEQFRLHVVTGSGRGRKTIYRVYPTRDLAEAALIGARNQAQGTTVRQAVDAFRDNMRASGCGAGTVTTAEHRLWHLLGLPRNSERPLRWLSGRGAELYATAQVGRAADTHQGELAKAKELGDFCVRKKWLKANPFGGVDPTGRKIHGADKPRLTVDESRKLRAHCHSLGADSAAVITLAYLLLGTRASELVNRDVRDLDDGGRLLWIGRTKTKAGTRRLIVPEELRSRLLEMASGRSPDAPLFLTEQGTRPTRYWAHYHVRRLCTEARVPTLPPQALPHAGDARHRCGYGWCRSVAAPRARGRERPGGDGQVLHRSQCSQRRPGRSRAPRDRRGPQVISVEITLETPRRQRRGLSAKYSCAKGDSNPHGVTH